MVRGPYYDKNGIKRGAWSSEEDEKLRAYVERYGHWNWRELPKFAGKKSSISIYTCILDDLVSNLEAPINNDTVILSKKK